MKRTRNFFILWMLLVAAACTRQQEQPQLNSPAPKVVEAKGYVVPEDRLAEPKVVPAGKPKVVRAGNPKVFPTNTNIHPVGNPKVVMAGTPKVCTPGQNGFFLPKNVPAIDSSFVAGIPLVVLAKDAYCKEINPQNFSSFGKGQGLKHGNVNGIVQDKKGNLWFGTEGGVSKFDGRTFTHYTTTEGLVNNEVLSISEDRKGNFWFGTWAGICRLSQDGKRFTHFTAKEGLSQNRVTAIWEDKKGNLWFGSDEGVARLNPDQKTFTHFTEKEGLIGNGVSSILEDNSGNLWFGTSNGVSKYDGRNFTQFTEKEGLSSGEVSSILVDKTGNLWFGTSNGVSKYDGRTFTNFTRKEGLSSNTVLSEFQDKNGNLWFGTKEGGACRLSQDGKTITHFSEEEGLSHNQVNCILEDNSGTLWFGTKAGGVSKYQGNLFTHYTRAEGLNNNMVWSIFEDSKGILWIGTESGVSRLSRDRQTFTHFTEKEGLTDYPVYCILEDKNGNLWFATVRDGVIQLSQDGRRFSHFTKNEGLSGDWIRCIIEDRSGNFWFSMLDGGGVSRLSRDGKNFTQYTVEQGLNENSVRPIIEDKEGNIWFGTDSKGVTRFSRDGKTITQFTMKEGLSHNSIHNMFEDREGNIWFGTYGNGVSQLSKDGKKFTHFTDKNGLTNNNVFSSMEDHNGNLWFGTRFGISKIPSSSLALEKEIVFKNYNYEDGFTGIGVLEGSICEDREGTIWFGANNGLTACRPEGDLPDTVGPCTQLTNLDLFNENILWPDLEKNKDTTFLLGNGVKVGDFHFDSVSDWYFLPENLSLAYNNNFLIFRYIGITQKQPKKVTYQYKLEGFDEHWSAITSRNDAPYGNLPHGTYTFKVKAMNSDGYWSKELNYTFTIRPPWYKTIWFRLLTALFILSSLFLIYQWRTASLRRHKKMLEKTVKDRTAKVVQQKEELETTLNKLKQTQSQLIQSEKMASLGMLTAGIAHEINNPVNFINSGVISLQKDYEDLQRFIQSIGPMPPESQKIADEIGMDELLKIIPQTIDDIKTGVHRTSEIVKGLRNFTRMDTAEMKEADLHEGIDSALLMLSHKIKGRIDIIKMYDEHLGFIRCFPGPLNQVFINLLNNAIDAIDQKIRENPEGTGEAGEIPMVHQFQIRIKTKLVEEVDDKHVTIIISDNGVGIPDKFKDKIFDPFFTTKEVGKGTGLGLSICLGIIEKHGGRITFESKPGEGTSFTIYIPD